MFLIEPAAERKSDILFVKRKREGEFAFETLLPEQLVTKAPLRRHLYGMLVSIDRLIPMVFHKRAHPAAPANAD